MDSRSTAIFKEAEASLEEAKKIQAAADKEDRPYNEDETKKIEEFLTKHRDLTARATAQRKAEQSIHEALQGVQDRTDAFKRSSQAPLRLPAEAIDHQVEAKHGFRHLGEFATAVMEVYDPQVRAMDQRLLIGAAASGLQQAVGSAGGFLVPPAFSTAIWDGLAQGEGNLMALCDSYPVEGESLTFNAVDETSRLAGYRAGGVRGYWLSEAAQITGSQPKFRQIRIEPQQLAVLIYATDKLLRNNQSALDTFLARKAVEEINFLCEDAIINGTGAGQPKGILVSGCVVEVAKEASQTNLTVIEANICKMRARLHPRSLANSVWLCNQDVRPSLDKMATTIMNIAGAENVGGSFSPVYNRDNDTILGRPVIITEHCQTVGYPGDIILADMKGYCLGRRASLESAMSIHLRFDYAESVFRWIFEVDGQPWLQAPLTPAHGSNTLTQFVTLAARHA